MLNKILLHTLDIRHVKLWPIKITQPIALSFGCSDMIPPTFGKLKKSSADDSPVNTEFPKSEITLFVLA